jgi:hypothetical protein
MRVLIQLIADAHGYRYSQAIVRTFAIRKSVYLNQLDDLTSEAGQSIEFGFIMSYAYFSDVIILCVEGRLSPVVASQLKFKLASPQPHVSRNLGDFNVETYARYMRAPV